MAARTERVRKARLQLAALRDAHFIYTLPQTPELERRWIDMDDEQRRALIVRVIDCVFVSGGCQPMQDRVTVCRAGTAPRLPRIGDKGGAARPFAPRAVHRSPAPKPWPTKRIENELTDYLHGQRTWPAAERFVIDGRRRLYDQVVRHAGIACWAHHFGLPILFNVQSREPWTDQRIRAALGLYLRGKRRFPTEARFYADGLGSLRSAINHSGGIRPWSDEFGKPLTPRQRARALSDIEGPESSPSAPRP
jgi:hypothetical protein